MILASYLKDGEEQLAFVSNGRLYDTDKMHPEMPATMGLMLNYWEELLPIGMAIQEKLDSEEQYLSKGILMADVTVMAPVPHPTSCRDGYAFRQHVAAARRNRGVDMIPEYDQFPIFYFTNHNSVHGPGNIYCMPDHFKNLDFELEAAIVISKPGRNIKAADADEYIAGLMVMNDMSARVLQMEEMLLNLGPAKGKDFSTVIGPKLVSLQALQQYETACKEGHVGKAWNLPMTCHINGTQVSSGNLKDMDWTFAEIVERCSYGVTLYPGDVIGSGTVGTGCFLELNGTGKLNDPQYEPQWLKDGDVIDMKIEALGTLTNTIVAEDSDFSILKLKKNI